MKPNQITSISDKIPYWPRLLGAEQAACYLGISRSNFIKRVKQNLIPPPKRIGLRVLWDIRQLDAYADALFGTSVTEPEPETIESNEWEPIVVESTGKRRARR